MPSLRLMIALTPLWIAAHALAIWFLGVVFFIDQLDLPTVSATDPKYFAWVLAILVATLLLQVVFLLPVRRSAMEPGRSSSMRFAATIAGTLASALIAGFILAICDTIAIAVPDSWLGRRIWFGGPFLCIAVFLIVPIWVPPPPQSRREAYLAKLASVLAAAAIIETIIVVPIYANARANPIPFSKLGSTVAVAACLLVGIFTVAPAVLLSIIVTNRRIFYETHCTTCGYDMKGLSRVARCPECGGIWLRRR